MKLATALAVALAAGVALGSEERAAEHAPSIADLLLPLVNFALFGVLIWRRAWPALRSSLAGRRRDVESALADADRALRAAKGDLEAMQSLRARQDEEARRIIAELREEGERQREAILEAARRTAERLRRDAGVVGEQEAAQAAKALRAEVASSVVNRAAAVLRERLAEVDPRGFVRSFLEEVERERRVATW